MDEMMKTLAMAFRNFACHIGLVDADIKNHIVYIKSQYIYLFTCQFIFCQFV